MNINQENYGQFFLDHAEGNLSQEMERELVIFLEANPDLKPVLEEFNASPLPAEEINNDSLKKRLIKQIVPTNHISEDNVDEWMIRDVDDLLNEDEKDELNEFLSLNPAYSYDHKLFGYTKLTRDLSISFPRKNELKKKGALLPASRLLWFIPAAAAIILLFVGIRFSRQPEIQPAHRTIIPVAEVPALLSPGIAGNSSFPAIAKKAAKTGKPSRVPPLRIKPVGYKAGISMELSVEPTKIMASRNGIPVITAGKKEPSLFARVFNNVLDQAMEGISNRTDFAKIRKPDFSFWTLAKAGIDGFNNISDRDLELYVGKDKDGKVKSYALIDQDRLLLSKELNKE